MNSMRWFRQNTPPLDGGHGTPPQDQRNVSVTEGLTGVRPEPLSMGCPERGRLLLNGELETPVGRHPIPNGDLWKINVRREACQKQLFGFDWLDDLAAVKSREAIGQARKWVFSWFQHTSHSEFAWRANIAGRRVIRLRHHENVLLLMAKKDNQRLYSRQIERHRQQIVKQLGETREDLPRIEALVGLVYAELFGEENPSHVLNVLGQLAEAGEQRLKPSVGIQSRNPQELLEITELIQWGAALASRAATTGPLERLVAAISHAADILCVLRHADGSLARFHGGSNPPSRHGKLDRVLAVAGRSHVAKSGLAMGFARMSAGSTSVICDAASPHSGKQSHQAHASTLAIELVAGMTPIVVNQGAGAGLGKAERYESRQTASYSTIEIDGNASSRMSAPVFKRGELDDIIVVFPDQVKIEQLPTIDSHTLIVSHNGYAPLFGLTHIRRLDMNSVGDHIWAEDTLWATPGEDQQVLLKVISMRPENELPFILRFHLHPLVRPTIEENQRQVSLELTSGERWRFEIEGKAKLRLESSMYYDENQHAVVDSQQITFHSVIESRSSTQVRWSFRRMGAKS